MRWLPKYIQAFQLGFQTALEYRLNFLLSLVSAAYPVFIQSFMWAAIYPASGAVVYGYSFRQMLIYTFLAGLVGRIVRTGFEYEIMDDIKSGKFSRFLVQPLGYFPYRLCSYLGQKLPGLAMILGILALTLVGLCTLAGFTLELYRIPAFLLTLTLAVMLNFVLFYCFSSVAFWIVEIGFLFEGLRIVTILLSGGIFPLDVFGATFLQVANFLPFKYTVYYPINVLNGALSFGATVQGLLMQCLWIVVGLAVANGLWRLGGRRYVAVGG
jgi:ABC-2 type transport system permease protein